MEQSNGNAHPEKIKKALAVVLEKLNIWYIAMTSNFELLSKDNTFIKVSSTIFSDNIFTTYGDL